jgi:NAD(P) transhydrogenase
MATHSDFDFDYDLVCVGSGPAGQRAAVQAAKLGKRVAVIERHRVVGGVCLETGTIPSKTFREAVIAAMQPCGTDRTGAFAEGADEVTIARLMERIDHVVRSEAEVFENQLHRNGITLLRGDASFTGPHELKIESEGRPRNVAAANIVIACGTIPSAPPGIEVGDVVVTSDEVLHMERLPNHMAVVGGGVIGIEYASMFGALGVDVTLIERGPRPLDFLDHEMSDELMHQMRNANVTFRLEETVAHVRVEPAPHPRAIIELESGKKIVAERVLYAIGRVGATESLGLANAGLSADVRGRLKVNERFQTEIPHIYAVGDVIGFPSLAATSSEQGRLAACFAFLAAATPMAAHFPIGIYAIPEISMVGSPEHELTAQKIPYEVGTARYREIARGQILGDNSGMLKMLFHRETRKLLGVHVIGTSATELVHIGQAVMGLDGGLDYFLNTVFNYPTLAECYKVAALNAWDKLELT